MKFKSLVLIIAVALVPRVVMAQQSTSDGSVEFRPHLYGQLMGGAAHTVGETTFLNLISPAGAVNLGYQFTPAFGVRLGAAGWQGKGALVAPTELYKFGFLQGNLDLTLSLANLFGYDHARILNPYLFVGGGAALGLKNGANSVKTHSTSDFGYLWADNKLLSPLGRAGIGFDVRLTDCLSLNLEANGNVLSDRFNSKKAGNPDYQYNALVGLKYVFGGKPFRTSAKYVAEVDAADAAAAALKAQQEAERAAKLAAEKEAAEKAAAEKALADKLAAEKAAAEKLAAEMRQVNTFFTINSSVISDEEAEKLIRFIDWLKANPELNISVAGHADKGTGNQRINQKLSDQRAAAVKAFLTERGIDGSRILSVVGNGDRVQPFAENDLNRVVFSVVEN